MLPRGVELVRLLQLRHRLLGRQLDVKFLHRVYTHSRLLLESAAGPASRHKPLRTYSKNSDKKILTAQTKSASQLADTATTRTKQKTSKSNTTDPKQVISGPAATTESLSATVIPVDNTPTTKPAEANTPTHFSTTPLVKQTKKLEIKTPKGVLSVTTTIEDSKINDIVFEKVTTPKSQIPPATISAEEVDKLSAAATAVGIATGAAAAATATGAAAAAAATTAPVPAVPAAGEKPKATEALKEVFKAKVGDLTGGKLAAGATKDGATTAEENAIAADAAAMAAGAPTGTGTAILLPLSEPVKPQPKRVKVDFNRSSLERNFITPARAMSDFLLKASDLESLSKIKRRSPYEQEPPITVFWRRDVEAKAFQVWGSREELLREILKREIERKKHQQNIFTVKRRLRDYRREIGSRTVVYDEPGLSGKSGKVVLIAIGINGINFLFKVCGWLYTGSHSMFAEAIHSLADTINQLILAYGIHKSVQMADSDHPYGYANMKYVSSLISGVGIFCVGTGVSFYHGITGLMHPAPMEDFFWAFFILGGSLVSEGATLLVAMNEVRRSAKLKGISFKDYVLTGKDPCVNVVLTEDAAAVTSVTVAAACMGLTSLTGSPVFDAVGSLLVGGILGAVASFIIYTNVQALVGRSIAEEHLNKINFELESDVMIRAIHDVKGIDMGNSLVRYKAEMDFDGRELTRVYLDKQDLNELLKVVKSFQTVEELERFLLTHGENIVDLMGGEIDRIEMKLRKKFPEIRHCDLEIL